MAYRYAERKILMNSFENASVLVVDDDHDIVNAIGKILSLEGYKIFKAYNGLEAIDSLIQNEIHLIIIDVMMPKLDGLSAMMKIRTMKNIPIIVLSAKSEDSDKILGLSMGADDYITKPYNPMELVARVKSNLRRYLSLGAADSVKNSNCIQIGGLTLNKDEKMLYADGAPVKLTATEYKITELLMENAGCVFSAEDIYSKVWSEESFSVENTVMVHIRHIREKIEINPKEPRYLKVVWGIGYKIEKIAGGKT